MKKTRVSQALLAALVIVAATLLPVRMAWSEPSVRVADVAAVASTVALLPYPASHLALRWNGSAASDAIEVRWRAPAAPWSPWARVVPDEDSSDAPSGRVASALILTSDAIAAEFRVTAGAPRSVRFAAIDTHHGPRHLMVRHNASPTAAAVAADQRVAEPSLITRVQWGADESIRTGTPEFAPIKRMVVHHTATANDDPDPASTVRAIYAYHTQSNGWNDIGYNFLIDAQGRIYEGRYAREYKSGEIPTGEDSDGNGVIGAHTLNNNTGSVGVALLGTFSSVPPTSAAIASLQRLLAWKADRQNIDPLGTATWSSGDLSTIIGHRDAGATECPGGLLYDRLPAIRQAVANTIGAARGRTTVSGYWVLGRDAALYAFGSSQPLTPSGPPPPAPANSVVPTASGNGLWVLSASGRITPFGDAVVYGSTEMMKLNAPAVRLEPTPTGRGYWVLAADGGIFAFGDAGYFGSTGDIKLNKPIISMAATRFSKGYWLLAADGGVFTFGDGLFFGSTGDLKLNAPIVSMAPHPSGQGYWLQAGDGGIFSFGSVRYFGSVPGLELTSPPKSVQIRVTPSGLGYYVISADGGIFTFGDATFYDAHPGLSGPSSAIDLALRIT